MEVFCYRNLGRKGVVWSVRDVKSGLVIDRSKKVVLKNVQLKVSQAGRARVLASKTKNVHAGVKGKRIQRAPSGTWIRATYNPYKMDSFSIETPQGLTPIKEASYVKLTSTGLYVMIREK